MAPAAGGEGLTAPVPPAFPQPEPGDTGHEIELGRVGQAGADIGLPFEAMTMATQAGISPEAMLQILNNGTGRNFATTTMFPQAVLPGTFDFGFPVGSVCKDIGLAVDECQALGVPTWVGSVARQVWNYAAMQDGSKRDMTELVKYVERWSSGEGLAD